jgi:hypothetical protein
MSKRAKTASPSQRRAMTSKQELSLAMDILATEGTWLAEELGLDEKQTSDLVHALRVATVYVIGPLEEMGPTLQEHAAILQSTFRAAVKVELMKPESRSNASILWHDLGVAQLCNEGASSVKAIVRWLERVSKGALS